MMKSTKTLYTKITLKMLSQKVLKTVLARIKKCKKQINKRILMEINLKSKTRKKLSAMDSQRRLKGLIKRTKRIKRIKRIKKTKVKWRKIKRMSL